jgi:hypothetical protein
LNEPAAGQSLTGGKDDNTSVASCDADIFIASPIRAALSALKRSLAALKRSLVLAAVIADIAVLPGHF